MHWLILCNDCADELDEDTIAGIFEAKFGQVEVEFGHAVLVCQPWNLPRNNDNEPVMQFFCDECGTAIVVAQSSQWFIDSHRQERDEQLGRTCHVTVSRLEGAKEDEHYARGN